MAAHVYSGYPLRMIVVMLVLAKVYLCLSLHVCAEPAATQQQHATVILTNCSLLSVIWFWHHRENQHYRLYFAEPVIRADLAATAGSNQCMSCTAVCPPYQLYMKHASVVAGATSLLKSHRLKKVQMTVQCATLFSTYFVKN